MAPKAIGQGRAPGAVRVLPPAPQPKFRPQGSPSGKGGLGREAFPGYHAYSVADLLPRSHVTRKDSLPRSTSVPAIARPARKVNPLGEKLQEARRVIRPTDFLIPLHEDRPPIRGTIQKQDLGPEAPKYIPPSPPPSHAPRQAPSTPPAPLADTGPAAPSYVPLAPVKNAQANKFLLQTFKDTGEVGHRAAYKYLKKQNCLDGFFGPSAAQQARAKKIALAAQREHGSVLACKTLLEAARKPMAAALQVPTRSSTIERSTICPIYEAGTKVRDEKRVIQAVVANQTFTEDSSGSLLTEHKSVIQKQMSMLGTYLNGGDAVPTGLPGLKEFAEAFKPLENLFKDVTKATQNPDVVTAWKKIGEKALNITPLNTAIFGPIITVAFVGQFSGTVKDIIANADESHLEQGSGKATKEAEGVYFEIAEKLSGKISILRDICKVVMHDEFLKAMPREHRATFAKAVPHLVAGLTAMLDPAGFAQQVIASALKELNSVQEGLQKDAA